MNLVNVWVTHSLPTGPWSPGDVTTQVPRLTIWTRHRWHADDSKKKTRRFSQRPEYMWVCQNGETSNIGGVPCNPVKTSPKRVPADKTVPMYGSTQAWPWHSVPCQASPAQRAWLLPAEEDAFGAPFCRPNDMLTIR